MKSYKVNNELSSFLFQSLQQEGNGNKKQLTFVLKKHVKTNHSPK